MIRLLLDVRTFVAHLLLRHLKSARTHLMCSHLHATIAATRARIWLGDGLVANDLNEVARVDLFETHMKIHGDVAASRTLIALFTTAATAAKREKVAEKALERILSVAHVALLHALFAILVVDLSLLWIAENL